MSRNETMRALFDQARADAAFRARFMATTGYSRKVFGWMACLFAALAVGTSLFLGLREGVCFSRTAGLCSVSFAVNLLLRDKMGERLAILESMGGAAAQESGPPGTLDDAGRVPGP